MLVFIGKVVYNIKGNIIYSVLVILVCQLLKNYKRFDLSRLNILRKLDWQIKVDIYRGNINGW